MDAIAFVATRLFAMYGRNWYLGVLMFILGTLSPSSITQVFCFAVFIQFCRCSADARTLLGDNFRVSDSRRAVAVGTVPLDRIRTQPVDKVCVSGTTVSCASSKSRRISTAYDMVGARHPVDALSLESELKADASVHVQALSRSPPLTWSTRRCASD